MSPNKLHKAATTQRFKTLCAGGDSKRATSECWESASKRFGLRLSPKTNSTHERFVKRRENMSSDKAIRETPSSLNYVPTNPLAPYRREASDLCGIGQTRSERWHKPKLNLNSQCQNRSSRLYRSRS